MFGLECIHGVVIHGVEFFLTKPIEKVYRQQLEKDVDKTSVVLHVHWEAVVRDLTDDPSTATGAYVHLERPGRRAARQRDREKKRT